VRILLVRMSALGDIIHTWPLAAAIKAVRPELHLTWVVEEPFRVLVDGHPSVDSVLVVNTRRWRRRPISPSTRAELADLRSQLRELSPDLVLDPQGVVKSAAVAWLSGAPRRVGLARPWRRERLVGLAYSETVGGSTGSPHVVATNLELLRTVGIEPPSEPTPPDGRWLVDRRPQATVAGPWREPFAVLLPGAGRPAKILSVATLAEVARRLAGSGVEVVVAWGPAERERASAVVDAAVSGTHLAPPTDLVELARLLARARVVVGGDTGPVHLAASLGVPTMAVFLATSWQRNRPLGARVGVVSGAADEVPRATGSARSPQVRAVAADEIIAAVSTLLGGGG